jgi:hypothetical protein
MLGGSITGRRRFLEQNDRGSNTVGHYGVMEGTVQIGPRGLVPSLRLTEALFRPIDPSGAAAIAGSVTMVGSDDEIARRGERLIRKRDWVAQP